MSAAPAGTYVAGWIYAANDIFLGSQIGQIAHYDGTQGTTIDTGLGQIMGMWGAPDHTLFVYSASALGELKSGPFKMVWQPNRDGAELVLNGLWGNSSTEVFMSVIDPSQSEQLYQCGATYLLWFDGSEVHAS